MEIHSDRLSAWIVQSITHTHPGCSQGWSCFFLAPSPGTEACELLELLERDRNCFTIGTYQMKQSSFFPKGKNRLRSGLLQAEVGQLDSHMLFPGNLLFWKAGVGGRLFQSILLTRKALLGWSCWARILKYLTNFSVLGKKYDLGLQSSVCELTFFSLTLEKRKVVPGLLSPPVINSGVCIAVFNTENIFHSGVHEPT